MWAASPSGAIVNNDWLITPQITLNASGNTLKFWAKSCDATYGDERFKVGVSTTGTAPANFTIISPGAYITTASNVTYVEYTYSLDAYAGQQVYVGFNCVSNDRFGFAIDDVSVTANVLATENFVASHFSVFPNPANDVLHISGKKEASIQSVQITDLNGRVVKAMTVNEVQTQINISDLNTGVYMLKIVSDRGTGVSKILKK